MSIGLIALLDDVAALAKVAAASLDDVAAQAAGPGAKAAGVVIDDAAVTPRYVVGFAASARTAHRRRIALGSLKNKLIFLLPAALALSVFAPWAITPLLMLGGAFLCYEGAEKVYEALLPHAAHEHEAKSAPPAQDAAGRRGARRSRGAIQTDFILSAEIMAITLCDACPTASFWTQAVVLAVVGIGITAAVYGAVALIVKADDAGVALAAGGGPAPVRALGRGLVVGMPVLLKLLGLVGTAAMLWVGGGILLHGLEEYGVTAPGHAAARGGRGCRPGDPGARRGDRLAGQRAGLAVVGLLVGAALIPVVDHLVAPLARRLWPAKAAAGPAA